MGKNGKNVVVIHRDKDLVEKLEDVAVHVIIDELIRKKKRANN